MVNCERKYSNRMRGYFISHINGFLKYRSLLGELVLRDIKVRYRKSFLGLSWTVLNPLLMMAVMVVVFSQLFRSNVDNYPLYLIIGNIIFGFFSSATTMGLNSVLWNSALIKKVYIPKYLFPLSVTVSSLVNFGFSAISMVIVMVITRAKVSLLLLALPLPFFYLFMFTFGVSMILSAVNVYFRDIEHLYGVVITAWMYLTPIFYTIDIVPDWARPFVFYNPLTQFIKYFRLLIMDGIFPSFQMNMGCFILGFAMMAIGMDIFASLQDKFILYI